MIAVKGLFESLFCFLCLFFVRYTIDEKIYKSSLCNDFKKKIPAVFHSW